MTIVRRWLSFLCFAFGMLILVALLLFVMVTVASKWLGLFFTGYIEVPDAGLIGDIIIVMVLLFGAVGVTRLGKWLAPDLRIWRD